MLENDFFILAPDLLFLLDILADIRIHTVESAHAVRHLNQ